MSVLSIQGISDTGNIVQLVTDSLISDISQSEWLSQQEADITELNNGPFEWKIGDTVLLIYKNTLETDFTESQWFEYQPSEGFDQALIATRPQMPNLFGITAHAGGGQANAFQLDVGTNKITTAATAGDSVKLPIDVVGMFCVIQNLGANSIDVFPFPGGSINSLAVNAQIALPAGSRLLCVGMSRFNWATFINP